MPPAGFEPATPVVKWPQIYALDSTATVIGGLQLSKSKYKQCSVTQLRNNNLLSILIHQSSAIHRNTVALKFLQLLTACNRQKTQNYYMLNNHLVCNANCILERTRQLLSECVCRNTQHNNHQAQLF